MASRRNITVFRNPFPFSPRKPSISHLLHFEPRGINIRNYTKTYANLEQVINQPRTIPRVPLFAHVFAHGDASTAVYAPHHLARVVKNPHEAGISADTVLNEDTDAGNFPLENEDGVKFLRSKHGSPSQDPHPDPEISE
ncbi:hypothetical protein PIB30_070903 [Stylosanthes scabra]|uniref:Uncharacterized protein n=1 Tax=Stylosanthes scabra TaxID=79078 RepID=A0ABU6RP09_9FABA|nr:hypothetical protein [Stylosanthes scabra]